MLTRTLALDLAADRITVNDIAPGVVLTRVNQAAIDNPKLPQQEAQGISLKRAAKPEEIARLAVFLASSDSDYVTGATYVIDGRLMQYQEHGP
jgi:glucose 1-dehydrogenase